MNRGLDAAHIAGNNAVRLSHVFRQCPVTGKTQRGYVQYAAAHRLIRYRQLRILALNEGVPTIGTVGGASGSREYVEGRTTGTRAARGLAHVTALPR